VCFARHLYGIPALAGVMEGDMADHPEIVNGF
jgi:hypothetical protein